MESTRWVPRSALPPRLAETARDTSSFSGGDGAEKVFGDGDGGSVKASEGRE